MRARAAFIVLAFLALRIALLFARDRFFDELFTVWITRQSFGGILHALQLDSGPPLFYFVVHALTLKTVFAARVLSLICASVSLACLLAEKRYLAAALLAVFPPSVLFAVDARSYAMCAMFVTIGVLALARDRYSVAGVSFVLAAYSHYYGFLFFPLLLIQWGAPAGARRRGAGAPLVFAICAIAYAPALWLAMHQPAAATAWIGRFPGWP